MFMAIYGRIKEEGAQFRGKWIEEIANTFTIPFADVYEGCTVTVTIKRGMMSDSFGSLDTRDYTVDIEGNAEFPGFLFRVVEMYRLSHADPKILAVMTVNMIKEYEKANKQAIEVSRNTTFALPIWSIHDNKIEFLDGQYSFSFDLDDVLKLDLKIQEADSQFSKLVNQYPNLKIVREGIFCCCVETFSPMRMEKAFEMVEIISTKKRYKQEMEKLKAKTLKTRKDQNRIQELYKLLMQ